MKAWENRRGSGGARSAVGDVGADSSDSMSPSPNARVRAPVVLQKKSDVGSVSRTVGKTLSVKARHVGADRDAILSGVGHHAKGVLGPSAAPAAIAAPEKTLVKPCKSKVVAVVELSPQLSELALPSAGARMAELGEILAAGYSRLLAQKSRGQSVQTGESTLDISNTKSGHPTSVTRRTADA